MTESSTTDSTTGADLRGELLATAEDLKTDIAEVDGLDKWPTFAGKVGVIKLASREADAWEASLTREVEGKIKQDFTNMRAKLVIRCAVGLESGERIFKDGDTKAVGEMPSDLVGAIFTKAIKHNGINEGATEEAAGNSSDDQSG